jgi:methionyl-tRNA formyltransferase
MKVIFIGGLTNGKIVYNYLKSNKWISLELCITYPDDSNKPRHVNFPNYDYVIKSGTTVGHINKIGSIRPDLIIVAGWSELLGTDILKIPTQGVIGFHPSKLPMDRGRSVIAWQIEAGYTETGLTMFYYNELPDGGDIVAIENILIEHNDYVSDILDKIDFATNCLMRAYFPLIRQGLAPRRKQNVNEGNFRRLRTSEDSQINWNTNTQSIYNKIRAISYPYPCAEFFLNDKRFKVKRAQPLQNFTLGYDEPPGTLIARLYDESLVFKTKDGFIRLIEVNEIK